MPPKSIARRKRVKNSKKKIYTLWLIQFIVIFSCISAAYILWLDYRIKSEFEVKKWSLPARVYASPLDVYKGQQLSLSRLERELLSVGYKETIAIAQPGEYRKTHNKLEFIKRPFRFWDIQEPVQSVRVLFNGEYINELINARTSEGIAIVRLEPQLIGKIYPEHNEDRVLVANQEIPQFLVDALIAVEDRHFYYHIGIDFRGILRAIFSNFLKGELSQGGSTLTQQLIKNFFLTPDRSFWRKFNEVIMAILLEVHYSKEEILSAYINEIYLGQHGARSIHGFGTAAEFYYARPLNELRLDQIAMLVGLVRGASFYNPRRHPQRALDRRNLVLRLMQQQGYLQQGLSISAQSKSLDLAAKPTWGRAKYPAFLELVRRQLLRDYRMQDLQTEGLRIFTTFEPQIQESAGLAVRTKLTTLEKKKSLATGTLQTAAIIVRIGTADVLAVIGSRKKQIEGFNRALDAKRPIGSLIKPAIYLTALSTPEKYNLLSLIDDSPIAVRQHDNKIWEPRNYDRKSHGLVLLLDAMKNSYNLASVRLGLTIGLDKIIETIKKTGIEAKINPYPSLLLGSLELTPFEVAQMYQTIANGGFQLPLNSIREVLGHQGQPLQRYGLEIKQTLESAPVFLTNFLLMEVVRSGTAKKLNQILANRVPLAGKTGTTNDLRDSWFAGFGDDFLAVVWMGRDDNQPSKFTGTSGAMQLWLEIMSAIRVQPLNLIAPEEIEWINPGNKRQRQHCAGLNTIPYIKGFKSAALEKCQGNTNNRRSIRHH